MHNQTGKLLALLLALVTVFALAACGPAKEPAKDVTTEPGSGEETAVVTEEVYEPISITENGSSHYIIYYPEGDDELFGVAKRLAETFLNYTGARLQVSGDQLNRGEVSDPDALEILIGATNRPETAQVKAKLGADEYAVWQVRGKLVLVGYGNAATTNAVDFFIKNYLRTLSFGTKDATVVFEQTGNYYHEVSHYIRKLTIGGADISECQIVVPEKDTVEEYIALLLRIHIATYHGCTVPVVTDDQPAKAHEIRIGKTKRTTATAEAGRYNVEMVNGSLEAVCDQPEGYGAILRDLRDNIIPYSSPTVELVEGQGWDGKDAAHARLNAERDLRILYHNIWGNRNANVAADPNYPAMRPDLMLAFYTAYDPDVICWQEAQNTFRSDPDSAKLFTWLRENYTEVVFSDGMNNGLWVRKSGFEVVASKYFKARNGDKGTTAAIVKVVGGANDGKMFGVMSAHYAANTNAGGDNTLGDQYRAADALKSVEGAQWIRSQEGCGNIDVFLGGDLNCVYDSDAYRNLTNNTFKNVRTYTTYDHVATYNGFDTQKYIKDYNIFQMNTKNVSEGSDNGAIDHVLSYGGEPKTLTVTYYAVPTSHIACTMSDHLPHFIDLNWK